MRLLTPFCVNEGQFSADICDRIVELGDSFSPMQAEVAFDPNNNLRDSSVSWIRQCDETLWLYNMIDTLVREANARHWNWALTGAESMQYTEYGPKQFYSWHADQRREPYAESSRWPGQIRKISISVHLSDGDDYEGGEFIIEDPQTPPDDIDRRLTPLHRARARGSVIIFPSHLHHRVNPVISGKRRSLVAWFLGPPFV